MTDNELADDLSQQALANFCELQLHRCVWQQHHITGTSKLRFSAAALAALENGLCVTAGQMLKRTNVASLVEEVKVRFATHVRGTPTESALGLAELVPSRAEQEVTCMCINTLSGQAMSLDELLSVRRSYAEWFGTIQSVRLSGFYVFLLSANGDLSTALRQAFSFWYFGREAQSDAETELVEEVASNAHVVAQTVAKCVIADSRERILQKGRFDEPPGTQMPRGKRSFLGLFNRDKKIPASDSDRIALVRRLIYLRCQHSPEAAAALALMGTSIEDFDDTLVMSMPEASIMRIVEQYTTGIEQGAPDDTIIPFLNRSHTVALSMVGQHLPPLQPPYSLERYLCHFLDHVHPQGVRVTESFIPIGIHEVRAFYGR